MTQALHSYTPGPLRLHYLDWQPPRGPLGMPVLFVPGFLDHAAHWTPIAAALASGDRRSAPRRCVAVDLRGRGESEAPAQGYTVADHADDIARVAAAAGLQRFLLVAFSLGVAYAAAYAAREPARVAGIVVGDYPARSLRIAPAQAAAYLAEPSAFPSWEAARRHFAQRQHWSDEYWEQVKGDLLREVPGGGVARWYAPEALQGLLRETDDGEWWDALARPGRPLLVLQGERSRALSPDSIARYRALGARVVTVPGAGHDVFAYNPTLALRELRDLLFWLDGAAVTG